MAFMAKQRAIAHYNEGTRTLMDVPPSSLSTPGLMGWLTPPLLRTFEKAVKHLRKAVKLDPHSAYAFNNLAHALFRLGEHKNAVKGYKQAKLDVALASYNVGEHKFSTRALKYFGLEVESAENDIDTTFELALDAADRAISIRYDFPEAHNTRAMILAKLFRFDDALKATEIALSQKPDYKNAIENQEKIKGMIIERASVHGCENDSTFLEKIKELKRTQSKVWKDLMK